MVEKHDQDAEITSRWLWNEKYDDHGSVIYRTPTMTLILLLHTIYLE